MRLLARYAIAYATLLAGPLALLAIATRRGAKPKARARHVLVPPIWHDALRRQLEQQERTTAEWLARAHEPELRRFWPTDPTYRITIPRRTP
jgi:hypothetical protein